MERVFQQFSASLTGQIYWFRATIEAALEKLVQDQVIQIKVINFTTEGDRKEKEKWALDFFKDHLLTQWFTPTLNPGKIAGESGGDGQQGVEKTGGDTTGVEANIAIEELSYDPDSKSDQLQACYQILRKPGQPIWKA